MINKLGLGTMGMNFENKIDSIATIKKALEQGITIFNTGDFYQRGQSQIVLGEALRDVPRNKYFISLKFGVTFTSEGTYLDVNPNNIKSKLLDSLNKMGLEYVDLYQPARQDTEIPVEDIVTEIKKLIEEGYVKHIGLSEVDAETLRRAHKIHPIHSVEVEYSLLNREIEKELIQAAKELGVNVVVYGAVGHGILTDKVFDETTNNPMLSRGIFNSEYKENNIKALIKFNDIAHSLGLSMSELALTYTQAKYDNIITLIGTTKQSHLVSSIKAINTTLSKDTINLIEETLSDKTIFGLRKRKWIFTNGIGKLQ